MFTDTKNLANASCNSEASSSNKAHAKSKGKLRHLWRLMTLRKDKDSKRQAAHPNNVNLNNSVIIRESVHDLTASQLEDYVASVRKMTTKTVDIAKHPSMAQPQSTDQALELMKVISSASIEKSTSASVNCVYGRNCQHNHKSYHGTEFCNDITPQSSLPIIEFPAESDLLEQVPIHYVHTDDGSFFWTLSHDRTDDDLLNAWLCHSLQQFPAQASQLC